MCSLFGEPAGSSLICGGGVGTGSQHVNRCFLAAIRSGRFKMLAVLLWRGAAEVNVVQGNADTKAEFMVRVR